MTDVGPVDRMFVNVVMLLLNVVTMCVRTMHVKRDGRRINGNDDAYTQYANKVSHLSGMTRAHADQGGISRSSGRTQHNEDSFWVKPINWCGKSSLFKRILA